MLELAPGIVSFENVWTESNDLLFRLNVSQENNLWSSAEVFHDNSDSSKSNLKLRDTDIIKLTNFDNDIIDKNSSILNYFSHKFYENTSNYVKQYCDKFYCILGMKENLPAQLLRYNKNQHYDYHVDDHAFQKRTLSLIYFINDDYEGGQVEFKNFNLSVSPQKNMLLLFPSNYMYMHRVVPVKNGTRYTIVQWFV